MKRTFWNIELVRKVFEDAGCVLLSAEYVRSKDKLDFICSCGAAASIAFDKFRVGQRCVNCRGKRAGEKMRLSYDFVKRRFAEGGCELLSKEYEAFHEKLRYKCSCGKEAYIAYAKFQAGQRCKYCKSDRISAKTRGSLNPAYKADKTDEQRIKDRKFPEYLEWRRKVYERDDYACQTCGMRGRTLNAHHIQSYAKFPELRTDIDNGITLCADCHKEYHRKIEHNTATLEGWADYQEWLDPPEAGEVEDDAGYY